MAACTTTYFEAGRSWNARVAEHNAQLMARQPQLRRRMRTPEFYFARHIDNSRLVKAADPVRVREMRLFYAMQHFSAIESGYRVEQEKQTLNQLREENRQLRLAEAELTQPGRIDMMARQLGLAAPQPGQVIHPNARLDSSAPVEARLAAPVSAAQ
jgi:hypothetical protein